MRWVKYSPNPASANHVTGRVVGLPAGDSLAGRKGVLHPLDGSIARRYYRRKNLLFARVGSLPTTPVHVMS